MSRRSQARAAAALLRLPERRQEAVTEFQTALQLKPDFEAARQMLRGLQTDGPRVRY